MGFSVATRTHAGLVREFNEDAVLTHPGQFLWAVADGMGGHDAGEVASEMVVRALAEVNAGEDARQIASDAMAAVQQVNTSLLDLSRESFNNRTIGSTVVAIVADRANYVCFWAGDSRAYLLREGTVSQLTRDHSLVQDLVDAGILNAEEAENHPNSNVITRAVGVEETLKIDLTTGALQEGDTFLIASDGLTRCVDAGNLEAELAGPDIEAVADCLLAATLAKGAPDNVSFAIIRCEPEAI